MIALPVHEYMAAEKAKRVERMKANRELRGALHNLQASEEGGVALKSFPASSFRPL